MKKERIRKLNQVNYSDGAVLYFMDRERRADKNWALIAAQKTAIEYKQPLYVIYVIPDHFLGANQRTYQFMLDGLIETGKNLIDKNIHFQIILGDPVKEIPKFTIASQIGAVFTDFSPLRLPRKWRQRLSQELNVPFYEVDSRNLIPCWVTSQKQEFAARTIRPKVHKLIPEYDDKFPDIQRHPFNSDITQPNLPTPKDIMSQLPIDPVPLTFTYKPGEKAAQETLQKFLSNLKEYDSLRNNPNSPALSNLSPYLHFGQISVQDILLQTRDYKFIHPDLENDVDAFLEELIVRRELADNYCYYNANYDNFQGFHEWAQKTLNEHRDDPRDYIYTQDQFENAQTHDPLWNAAQIQMIKEGKMHGFLRMYWCKKILEWTPSPEEAQSIAIYLNDKYELDGRDSNGYTGIAWSIGGVHDRAWFERPVYGKIRYMNYNGCKRKFKVDEFIDKYLDNKKTLFN